MLEVPSAEKAPKRADEAKDTVPSNKHNLTGRWISSGVYLVEATSGREMLEGSLVAANRGQCKAAYGY
jgi:hypothetical protein